MNRSLSFFAELKTKNKIYNLTENNTTNVLDDKNNIVDTKVSTNNYSMQKSLFNSDFIDYRGSNTNNNINPSSNTNNNIYDISEKSVIEWSRKYKSVEIKPEYIAYLKDVFVYPCNRFAILRRFPGGVDHDILNSTTSPISTMVSYVKPDDDNMTLSFGENWVTHNTGLLGVINDVIGISNVKLPTFQGTSNLFESISVNVGQALGITTSNINPLGNPNVIHEAIIRKTGSDFDGLNFDFSYKFETTYITNKYIKEIDPHMAFLDIVANALKMGTSPSEFIITPAFSSQVRTLMNKIMNGDLEVIIKAVIDGILEFLKVAIEAIVGVVKLNTVKQLIITTLSKYKWQLTGAISSLAGTPTAPWHLTLGNPKAPWFSMGNLILEKGINMKLSNNYNFNDVPDMVTYTINLKNGRRMGGQEIESIFNGGKGRIYHQYNDTLINNNVFTEKSKTNKDTTATPLNSTKEKYQASPFKTSL